MEGIERLGFVFLVFLYAIAFEASGEVSLGSDLCDEALDEMACRLAGNTSTTCAWRRICISTSDPCAGQVWSDCVAGVQGRKHDCTWIGSRRAGQCLKTGFRFDPCYNLTFTGNCECAYVNDRHWHDSHGGINQVLKHNRSCATACVSSQTGGVCIAKIHWPAETESALEPIMRLMYGRDHRLGERRQQDQQQQHQMHNDRTDYEDEHYVTPRQEVHHDYEKTAYSASEKKGLLGDTGVEQRFSRAMNEALEHWEEPKEAEPDMDTDTAIKRLRGQVPDIPFRRRNLLDSKDGGPLAPDDDSQTFADGPLIQMSDETSSQFDLKYASMFSMHPPADTRTYEVNTSGHEQFDRNNSRSNNGSNTNAANNAVQVNLPPHDGIERHQFDTISTQGSSNDSDLQSADSAELFGRPPHDGVRAVSNNVTALKSGGELGHIPRDGVMDYDEKVSSPDQQSSNNESDPGQQLSNTGSYMKDPVLANILPHDGLGTLWPHPSAESPINDNASALKGAGTNNLPPPGGDVGGYEVGSLGQQKLSNGIHGSSLKDAPTSSPSGYVSGFELSSSSTQFPGPGSENTSALPSPGGFWGSYEAISPSSQEFNGSPLNVSGMETSIGSDTGWWQEFSRLFTLPVPRTSVGGNCSISEKRGSRVSRANSTCSAENSCILIQECGVKSDPCSAAKDDTECASVSIRGIRNCSWVRVHHIGDYPPVVESLYNPRERSTKTALDLANVQMSDSVQNYRKTSGDTNPRPGAGPGPGPIATFGWIDRTGLGLKNSPETSGVVADGADEDQEEEGVDEGSVDASEQDKQGAYGTAKGGHSEGEELSSSAMATKGGHSEGEGLSGSAAASSLVKKSWSIGGRPARGNHGRPVGGNLLSTTAKLVPLLPPESEPPSGDIEEVTLRSGEVPSASRSVFGSNKVRKSGLAPGPRFYFPATKPPSVSGLFKRREMSYVSSYACVDESNTTNPWDLSVMAFEIRHRSVCQQLGASQCEKDFVCRLSERCLVDNCRNECCSLNSEDACRETWISHVPRSPKNAAVGKICLWATECAPFMDLCNSRNFTQCYSDITDGGDSCIWRGSSQSGICITATSPCYAANNCSSAFDLQGWPCVQKSFCRDSCNGCAECLSSTSLFWERQNMSAAAVSQFCSDSALIRENDPKCKKIRELLVHYSEERNAEGFCQEFALCRVTCRVQVTPMSDQVPPNWLRD